jgi:hypothetical protein
MIIAFILTGLTILLSCVALIKNYQLRRKVEGEKENP